MALNGTHREQDTVRPLVAVGYGPRCVPVMALVEAATGLCDLLWLVDTDAPEVPEMLDLLRRYGNVVDLAGKRTDEIVDSVRAHAPDGIVTYLDAGMSVLAEIAAEMGLPFHSPATACSLIDKARQREQLAIAGLDGPRCYVLVDGAGADTLARLELTWPAVLKPRAAQGSRRTFFVESPAEAAALLAEIGPFETEMILEEFIGDSAVREAGPFANYVSVESLAAAGEVSHLAVTGRFPLAENFRETGFFIPSALDDVDVVSVCELATQALRALAVTAGCFHTEVKLTPAGPRVIEVNGRVGGGVPEMLERTCSLPLLEITLKIALGEAVRVAGPLPCKRVGYRLFLQPPAISTVVTAVEGIDTVANHPSVDSVSVHQGPGAQLDWRDGSRTHILAVVGSTANHLELIEMDRLLRDVVTVTYDSAGA